MANFVFPLGRSVSTDGSLTGADTAVGDVLYGQATGSLSIRTQDAAGAPVSVAIPSVVGGSGTPNRVVKFIAGGSMDDSNISDSGSAVSLGQAGSFRLTGDYGGGTGWKFLNFIDAMLVEISSTGKLTCASDFTQQAGITTFTNLAGGAAGAVEVSAAGVLQRQVDATTTPYTAGVPGNWAGAAPTNIEAAVDRMAALLRALNGGLPIP